MTTNPNNAVGTNGAYGGRTSVQALNDIMAAFSGRGIVSGWGCTPSSGLTIAIGGSAGVRDVAIAEDANGNRTSINNISSSPISVTLAAAETNNPRIDAIVAYVANPPQGEAATIDNPGAVGLIAVSGTPSSSPTVPTESAIRSAITEDGAAGSNAYYVVLSYITVPAGATTIVPDNIATGETANIKLGAGQVTADNLDFATLDQADLTFGSGYSANGLRFIRRGDIVTGEGTVATPAIATETNAAVAFTLPEGWRPNVTINAFLLALGAHNLIARIRIDGNTGAVTISKAYNNDLPASTNIQFNALVYRV